jgi:arylsulfatase A-like enzyme
LIIIVFGLFAVSDLIAHAEPNSQAKEKPNFVFFLVDDLGWRDIGAFGSPFYETPNVDRLAASGMKFTNAYAASPVCTPTRSSIMTGQAPARTNTTAWRGARQPEQWNRNTPLLPASYRDHLRLEQTTLAEALKEGGYATFFAGKWHLGGQGKWPTDQGFDINKGGCAWGHPKTFLSPYGIPTLENGPKGEYLPLRLGRETVKFIEAHQDQPFFAYLSFYDVHTPLETTEALKAKYQKKKNRLDFQRRRLGQVHGQPVRLVQDHPIYGGMVEGMDRAVGNVLDILKKLNLEKDTVVIFMSDNGGLSTYNWAPTSNRPLRAGKGWLYEGGIRVPMIMRVPGITEAGSETDEPVISHDFYPTLLDLAGLQRRPTQHKDGVSLVPLLQGNKTVPRDQLFFHFPHYAPQRATPSAAVRQGSWKLIWFFENDQVELYNLNTDIQEMYNLAKLYPERTKRLKAELEHWLSKVDANFPETNPDYTKSKKNPYAGN